jgi:hypothetical protein
MKEQFVVIPLMNGVVQLREICMADSVKEAHELLGSIGCEYNEVRIYREVERGKMASIVWSQSDETPAPAKTVKSVSRSSWADDEEKQLLRLRDVEHLPYELIAKKMSRTASACSSRYSIINKRDV